MNKKEDCLIKLFENIELDTPRVNFADSVMNRINIYSKYKLNTMPLATFICIASGSIALAVASVILIFKSQLRYFIDYIFAPALLKVVCFIKTFSLDSINKDIVSHILIYISITIFVISVIYSISNKRNVNEHQRI